MALLCLFSACKGDFIMEMIKTSGITKIYGTDENKVFALDDVSFSVEQGEFVSVVGASGSGKSTLLHILGGIDKPTSGLYLVAEKDVYQKSEKELAVFRRREVGLIYQFYNLVPILNVEENISLPIQMDGKKTDKVRMNELLELLGLTDRRNHLPNQLSGGQQQRVAIGRALMSRPSILLADEPTGNLDSKNSTEILELLELSNKQYNQTLILVTHDDSVAAQADRVIELKDGQIFSEARSS